MDITELVQLTRWVDSEITGKSVLEKYTALQQILQGNTRPNQARQPFETERDELFSTIKEIHLESLNTQQLSFLTKLGIGENVSPEAITRIEDILFRNVIDMATASQKLTEIINEISQGRFNRFDRK